MRQDIQLLSFASVLLATILIVPITVFPKAHSEEEPMLTNKTLAIQAFEVIIKHEEGFSPLGYSDNGQISQGYGMKAVGTPVTEITEPEARRQSIIQLRKIDMSLTRDYPYYKQLSARRKMVLMSMQYQMGATGISKFVYMWANIRIGTFAGARIEMLNSKWAMQTPARARRHANAMLMDSIQPFQAAFIK